MDLSDVGKEREQKESHNVMKYLDLNLIQRLKTVGEIGYKTEKLREKALINQANSIFTIVSIFSLVFLYLFPDVIKLAGCRLYLFLGSIYLFLLISLGCAMYTHLFSKYSDMGTIEEMDEVFNEVIDVFDEETDVSLIRDALDNLYLEDLNDMHLCRRDTNDKRVKYLTLGYISLGIALLFPFILWLLYFA